MKKIFTLLFSIGAITSYGQITLNQSSFNASYVGTDSTRRADSSSMNGMFPTITATTNGSWDLSTLNYNSTNFFRPRTTVSSSTFPSAAQATNMIYQINASLAYHTNIVEAFTSNAYEFLGEQISRQAIPLVSLTGSATDSLVFLAQDVVYSSPKTEIKFPATMNTNWTGTYSFQTNFNLTIAAMSLNNTPCFRKTNYTYSNAVIGWGTVRVKNANGMPTAYMNVLMIRRMETVTDSFYIGGSPAPASLLTAFGLSQGMVSNDYKDEFVRTGEITPIAGVAYKGTTFAQNQIDYIETHMNRLPSPSTSLFNVSKNNSFNLYPNPIVNNQFTLTTTDKTIKELRYDIININGQIVKIGSVTLNSGSATIQLDKSNPSGIYYIRLQDNNNNTTTLPIDLP